MPAAEAYFVVAATEAEARSLVARNVSGARRAASPLRFDCEIVTNLALPEGVIGRRFGPPIPITVR